MNEKNHEPGTIVHFSLPENPNIPLTHYLNTPPEKASAVLLRWHHRLLSR